jgi:hypothetical protein
MRRSAWLVWLGLVMCGYSQAKLTLTPLDTNPESRTSSATPVSKPLEGDLPVGWAVGQAQHRFGRASRLARRARRGNAA